MPLRKENDNSKKITYKLKVIDTFRFMSLRYQVLLITYRGFMIKNLKNAWKEKKLR